MRKRVLPLFLALVLCLGLLPTAAMAADSGTCGSGLTWNYRSGVLTIEGKGAMADYYHEDTMTIDPLPWEEYLGQITQIRIGEGVTYIGARAFEYCTALTGVTIPTSVTAIGAYAFFGCAAITSVTIPGNVTTVGEGAFGECDGLTNLSLAEGVQTIGNKAFGWCDNLARVTIPNTVTYIGEMAFEACEKLDNLVIPGSVATVGPHAFGNCTGLTTLTLSDGITTIAEGAFYGCSNLAAVVIPDSVTSIEAYAFAYCFEVAQLVISKSITSIETFAFHGCSKVTDLVIPDGVTTIAPRAFDECYGMARLTLPASVTSIGEHAFAFIYMDDVYYGGTEEQWNQIAIGDYNEPLVSAARHYPEPAAPTIPESGTAYTGTQDVWVKDGTVTLHAYILRDENGNDMNFVKIRDVAAILNGTAAQFEIGWDGSINLEAGKPYTTATGAELTQVFQGDQPYHVGSYPVNVNGAPVSLTTIILTDSGEGEHNYVKLRDLAEALNFNVTWSPETGVTLQPDVPYVKPN